MVDGLLWPSNGLIPKAPDGFYAESWPFELIFDDGPDGAVHSMRVAEGRVT